MEIYAKWMALYYMPLSENIFLFSSLKLCLIQAYILKNFSLYMPIKVMFIKNSAISGLFRQSVPFFQD